MTTLLMSFDDKNFESISTYYNNGDDKIKKK